MLFEGTYALRFKGVLELIIQEGNLKFGVTAGRTVCAFVVLGTTKISL